MARVVRRWGRRGVTGLAPGRGWGGGEGRGGVWGAGVLAGGAGGAAPAWPQGGDGPVGMCVCICKPAYSSSLTDAEWALVEPLLPVHDPHARGRPPKHGRRLGPDSLLDVLGTGCAR